MKQLLLSTLSAALFLSTPYFTKAQSPNLGTTANFVLFSANGAVGNTGISQLTGNVGTNNGAITGFGNVNGVMLNNNGTTLTARNDVVAVWNQLNNTIPTFFPSPLLGNGDTLTAGVYEINAVTTLSGNLYLNAQGNPNAIFIFQIQAAFSTNANAKIKLINSAQSCNIYWKVEGEVNMGAATFMRGSVIANNAAIHMNINDTLEGRALSTTGAVTTNGVLAYTPPGCGKPVLTGPAAPNLASAVCYAVLSGNGYVINTGITKVTGDVGTNVGLTQGFNPLLVTGMIHPIPDGSTSAASADLLNAQIYLGNLSKDIELLYPAQFGNDLVLTPHTYLMNAAAQFTGRLYLNAEGNSNAVFVIKINGALTTSTFSRVVLINGAQAKNVYWHVNGAVTINDYSVFNGTLVSNNGAINLNTGDSINGRALTTNGLLSTFAVVVTSPNGACSVLASNLLYFNGISVQKNVQLQWGTSNTVSNGFFTIEKSQDGQRFSTLATVNTQSGSSTADHNYSYTDQQPDAMNFYRISFTNIAGERTYYKTIQVRMTFAEGLKVTHYVDGNTIYVQVSDAKPGSGYLELYSIEGRKIVSQKIMLTKAMSQYKIVAPMQKGVYLLSILGDNEKLYTGKVVN